MKTIAALIVLSLVSWASLCIAPDRCTVLELTAQAAPAPASKSP